MFFVYSYLTPLEFGSIPLISSPIVYRLLEENGLNSSAIYKLRLWIDINNICRLEMGGKFDERGNYSMEELKEYLAMKLELPDYCFEEHKEHTSLLSDYYEKEIASSKGFLRDFLLFNSSRIDKLSDNPLQLYEIDAKHRFDYFNNAFLDNSFSYHGICGYLSALWILENYFYLSDSVGNRLLTATLEE